MRRRKLFFILSLSFLFFSCAQEEAFGDFALAHHLNYQFEDKETSQWSALSTRESTAASPTAIFVSERSLETKNGLLYTSANECGCIHLAISTTISGLRPETPYHVSIDVLSSNTFTNDIEVGLSQQEFSIAENIESDTYQLSNEFQTILPITIPISTQSDETKNMVTDYQFNSSSSGSIHIAFLEKFENLDTVNVFIDNISIDLEVIGF